MTPGRFARAAMFLLADAAWRDAIVRAAREKIVRDHCWDMETAEMEEILARVAVKTTHAVGLSMAE